EVKLDAEVIVAVGLSPRHGARSCRSDRPYRSGMRPFLEIRRNDLAWRAVAHVWIAECVCRVCRAGRDRCRGGLGETRYELPCAWHSRKTGCCCQRSGGSPRPTEIDGRSSLAARLSVAVAPQLFLRPANPLVAPSCRGGPCTRL